MNGWMTEWMEGGRDNDTDTECSTILVAELKGGMGFCSRDSERDNGFIIWMRAVGVMQLLS
jgi:hypothetical protein